MTCWSHTASQQQSQKEAPCPVSALSLRSWASLPPSALTTTPPLPQLMAPLPCSLSGALDRRHPWAFLARLSCHLLQDMTLIHGILDLWKGEESDRPSPGLLTASFPGQSLRQLPETRRVQALPSSASWRQVTNKNSRE